MTVSTVRLVPLKTSSRPRVGEQRPAVFLEQHGECGQQQHKPEGLFDNRVKRLGSGMQGAQKPQRHEHRRDAAQGQQPGDFPVDVVVLAMDQNPAGFGNRRVQQVGADRRGRIDAEPQQYRRHQRAAADSGHANDESDYQPCNDETQTTRFHIQPFSSKRIGKKWRAA